MCSESGTHPTFFCLNYARLIPKCLTHKPFVCVALVSRNVLRKTPTCHSIILYTRDRWCARPKYALCESHTLIKCRPTTESHYEKIVTRKRIPYIGIPYTGLPTVGWIRSCSNSFPINGLASFDTVVSFNTNFLTSCSYLTTTVQHLLMKMTLFSLLSAAFELLQEVGNDRGWRNNIAPHCNHHLRTDGKATLTHNLLIVFIEKSCGARVTMTNAHSSAARLGTREVTLKQGSPRFSGKAGNDSGNKYTAVRLCSCGM